eukprot:4776845-Amphidinium_carterae.1
MSTAFLECHVRDLPDTARRQSDGIDALKKYDPLRFIVDGCNGEAANQLFAFAKFWHAKAAWQKLVGECGMQAPPPYGTDNMWFFPPATCSHISKKEERRALRWLQTLVASAKRSLSGGSIEDEMLLLKGSTLPPRDRD